MEKTIRDSIVTRIRTIAGEHPESTLCSMELGKAETTKERKVRKQRCVTPS